MIDEDEVRNRLVSKQTELKRRIAGTEATERSDVAQGDIDNAHLWEESDIRDDVDTQAARELQQVNAALARLDTGEYGICEECEEPIAEARLRALPYVTLCIQCAEEAERNA